MTYRALATDYDGTIATDGVVDDATAEALRRARRAGVALILVSGREAHHLVELCPHWRLFDRIVAENGAVLFDTAAGRTTPIAPAPPAALLDALRARGVPFGVGRSVVSTWVPHEVAVAEAIADLAIDWHVVMNKTAAMALPRGIDKCSGLLAASRELTIAPAQIVTVGDAENDIAMLRGFGLGVAVANALPSVKAAADRVTTRPRGAGVAELIDALLLGGELGASPARGRA